MKIGFSFGRCVRDIVQGKVAFDDVLVIVARTKIETIEQVDGVIRSYMYEHLFGLDYDACLLVARRLFECGRIHQPRIVNAYAPRVPESYVWMDAVPTALTDNPTVESAWGHYQMALKLAEDSKPAAPWSLTSGTISDFKVVADK